MNKKFQSVKMLNNVCKYFEFFDNVHRAVSTVYIFNCTCRALLEYTVHSAASSFQSFSFESVTNRGIEN
jgi:hypothetical protein